MAGRVTPLSTSPAVQPAPLLASLHFTPLAWINAANPL